MQAVISISSPRPRKVDAFGNDYGPRIVAIIEPNGHVQVRGGVRMLGLVGCEADAQRVADAWERGDFSYWPESAASGAVSP